MMADESRENRLKRLKMRSWRRGTKEMDLILGPFSDARLKDLSDQDLNTYEALLNQNDQDLYLWFSGQSPAPEDLRAMIETILPEGRFA